MWVDVFVWKYQLQPGMMIACVPAGDWIERLGRAEPGQQDKEEDEEAEGQRSLAVG